MTTTPTQIVQTRNQNTEKDIREIRNWIRFLGILAIIGVIASLAIGIVVGVQVAKVNQNLNGGSGGITCVQGITC